MRLPCAACASRRADLFLELSALGSRSRSHSPRRVYRCYFCNKKGHRQKDCLLYKKTRCHAQGEEGSKSEDNDNKTKVKSKDKPKAKETAYYSYTNANDYTL